MLHDDTVLDGKNIYWVTGYLLGFHVGYGQDEMDCANREEFKAGYDAGCADAADDDDTLPRTARDYDPNWTHWSPPPAGK